MITSLKIFEYALKQVFPAVQILTAKITEEGFCCDAALPSFPGGEGIALIEEAFKRVVKADYNIKTYEMMRENGAAFFKHRKDFAAAEKVKQWSGNTIRIAEIEGWAFPLFEEEIGISTGEGGALKILQAERQGEQIRFRVVVKEHPQAVKQWLKVWNGYVENGTLAKEMGLVEWVDGEPFWKPKGVWFREKVKGIFEEVLECSPYQKTESGKPYTKRAVGYFREQKDWKPLYLKQWGDFGHAHAHANACSAVTLMNTPVFKRKITYGFVPFEQVGQELISSLHFFDKIFKIFGFEGQWSLAADRAVQALVPRVEWDRAVKWLTGALEARGHSISEKARHPQVWVTPLEGPTLQAVVVDKLDRKWLVASLGIDLSFSAELTPPQGKASRLALLRGAVGESLERIIALLLERSQGVLPWELTPEQVRVVSVGQQCAGYAEEVHAKIAQAGFRVGIDCSESKLGAKVHAAKQEKIPYLVVVGEKELKNGQITVRAYEAHKDDPPEGNSYRVDDFLPLLERKGFVG